MTSRRRPGVVRRLFLRFVHTQKEGPFWFFFFARDFFVGEIFSHKIPPKKKKPKEEEEVPSFAFEKALAQPFFSTFLFLLFKTQLHPEHRLGRTSLSY